MALSWLSGLPTVFMAVGAFAVVGAGYWLLNVDH